MKIKRYVAKDMRTALAQIKEELGPEAVIMSNKKIPEGVELMAAVDYNGAPSAHKSASNTDKQSMNAAPIKPETSFNRQLQQDQVSLASSNNISAQPKQAENNNQPASSSLSALLNRNIQQTSPYLPNQNQNLHIPIESNEEADIKQQLKSFTQRLQQSTSAPVNTNSYDNLDEIHQQTFPKNTTDNSTRNGKNLVNNQEIDAIRDEMASIRQLLEYQVSGLMWQDLAQRDPAKAMLVDRLTSLGVTEQLAEQVAGFVPKKANEDEAWQSALHLLTQQINTTNNDIIHRGGIVALVGPTGVGKTTTIAKLAARFAQIHGNDSVALISTDTFRIAGFEQLQTYGRIIGCQVKLAKDKNGLDNLIQEFANKKLILIDTAGMGQRDLRLAQHLTTLISNTRVRIRNYLVLAANTQQSVMQENVERFKKIPLVGCIYTKLDESLSFGEMISTAIQNSLPIGYLTDGQRVPEDIKVANAEKLVMLASKKINKSTFNSPHQWRPQVNVSTVTI
ncbi:MAG: flagellar biosynthesis protein FlhF [Gammaproteobacteria bacterium]|nr:MAG: flagellar biosynthesis protein FlhF [Gammaproteobacteria bacterium]